MQFCFVLKYAVCSRGIVNAPRAWAEPAAFWLLFLATWACTCCPFPFSGSSSWLKEFVCHEWVHLIGLYTCNFLTPIPLFWSGRLGVLCKYAIPRIQGFYLKKPTNFYGVGLFVLLYYITPVRDKHHHMTAPSIVAVLNFCMIIQKVLISFWRVNARPAASTASE